jgi:hypothetical protein
VDGPRADGEPQRLVVDHRLTRATGKEKHSTGPYFSWAICGGNPQGTGAVRRFALSSIV